MSEDPLAPDLRKALRSLAEDTPSNDLARSSILAAVAGSPLEAVALEEIRRIEAEAEGISGLTGIYADGGFNLQDFLADRAEDDQPMTLTDFLLARIAEDEAVAQDWPVEGQWGKFDDDRMWQDPNGRPIYAPRAKVLADCEAKRRIVEGWQEVVFRTQVDLELTQGAWVLGHLAAVYADHPDYRDEWRP